MKGIISKIVSLSLVMMLVFTMIGCTKKGNKKQVSISMEATKTTLYYGEEAKLNVGVSGSDNVVYTFEISNTDLLTIDYTNTVSMKKQITEDTKVTVTAVSVADTTKKASVEFTLVAPKVYVTTSSSSICEEFGTADISVVVSNVENKAYTLTSSHPEVLTFEGSETTGYTTKVLQDVDFPTVVTITATLNADKTVVGTTTVMVNPNEVDPVQMRFVEPKAEIKSNETFTLQVEVTGTENKAFIWNVSDPTLVRVDMLGKVEVLKDVEIDTPVVIKATSVENPKISISHTLTIKAFAGTGYIGALTAEMIQELGNASITVTGVLTDVYENFKDPTQNSEHKYDMLVTMEEGKWSSSWNIQGKPKTAIVDQYVKGATGGIKGQNGQVGHALEEVYINKNNEVATSVVKNYKSQAAIWEYQHLWNHLGNLQIAKFVHDTENDVYEYKINIKNEADLYLMTYLSYSLTPLLSDTLDKLWLYVEDGHISKVVAQTEVLYYGADTREDATASTYSVVELTFSEVGTTVVKSPTPYEAPEFAELLQSALNKMGDATNYTFHAKDTTTYAPSTDAGDYSVESTSSTSKKMANPFTKSTLIANKVANYVSLTGEVGTLGKVTADAVLYANTGKYNYSMDGNNYHTEYSGLKQNTDGTYDEFEYNVSQKTLVGKRKVTGNIFDSLPNFDFSPNIFQWDGMKNSDGVKYYTFTLKETAITREVAMELSAYHYATDAAPAADQGLTIVIDEFGNLISSIYPYSLVQGTYAGYVSTTYSNIGTTTLPEDTFEGYVPRVIPTSWDSTTTLYYTPNFSTQTSRPEATSVVFDAVYGEEKVNIPSYALFAQIFDDSVFGPFYNFKEKGADSEGNKIYTAYVSINTQSSKFDENSQVTNFEEIKEALDTELQKLGFAISYQNTDISGGEKGEDNRYLCYIKEGIQIVVSNNHTKHFSIYFYKTGDWKLN